MKIMMFAHDGSLNRGCEAIVRSSAALLKGELSHSEIYLASGKPETDKVIPQLDGIYDGTTMPIRKYSPDWWISSMRVKWFRDETYALGRIHRRIIDKIGEMDVCLSIGGDNYCYGEQPGWYEIDRRVKAQGKKLVLWGCSIGEEDMSPRKLEDLKLFDLILTRETLTYNMLKSKGLQQVRLVADPAFTMEKEELELPSGWRNGNTVGLNFSPLVQSRSAGSDKAVKQLIRHILETTDMAIALTPHVMEHGNNDYELLQGLHNEFRDTGRVLLLPDHLTAVQYKGYIARMRFFIGARTHATIAAYSNCIPTLVLGYSVKSKGIAKDLFGEEKLVLDIADLSNGDKLIGGFRALVDEEDQIRETLRNALPGIREKSGKAVHYIKELVNG